MSWGMTVRKAASIAGGLLTLNMDSALYIIRKWPRISHSSRWTVPSHAIATNVASEQAECRNHVVSRQSPRHSPSKIRDIACT